MPIEFNSEKTYAVIGDPIKHSLSPEMQNIAFKDANLGEPYTKIHIPSDLLEAFCCFAREGIKGFNVTVPHKNAIISCLDEISDECKLSGSVNTVINRDGKLYGYSTDGYGLATAFKEAFNIDVKNGKFSFIGCGGAVKAVAFYFATQGAKELMFFNRTVASAEELAQKINDNFPKCKASAFSISDENSIKENFANSDVIIQGTSLGLKENDPSPINVELLPKGKNFYETIYKETKMVKAAKAKNMKIADGRSMLLHQGAESFRIWTGLEPNIELMRKKLDELLQ
ncbi:shikimate dehydrogenase [Lentisphaerota bacterium WC36G]|nr:shikimate dehydrogenase [Lentisphaerae bacterium WC36]